MLITATKFTLDFAVTTIDRRGRVIRPMSVDRGILARMFEQMPGFGPQPEVMARFDELFERHYPSTTRESTA